MNRGSRSRSTVGATALALVFVVGLFALSVFVRVPFMGRPLGVDEWTTSTVLRHQQIWWDQGALRYWFAPIATYPNPGDRGIANEAYTPAPDGTYYYTSYPPFAYIAPYVIFRALGVRPDVGPIQTFSLFVHLVTALLVYVLTARLVRENRRLSLAGLAAAAAYLFAPVALWYHSNAYMSDMLVQPLFVLGVLAAVIAVDSENARWRPVLAVSAVCAFMVYTEWLGALFVAALVMAAVLSRPRRTLLSLAGSGIGGAAVALVLTVVAYARPVGLETLLRTMIGTYGWRSGVFDTTAGRIDDPGSWLALARHYWDGYAALLVALAVLALVVAALAAFGRRHGDTPGWAPTSRVGLALFLTLVPVVLHHLLLFGFSSVHAFSVLKTGVPLALCAGLLVHQLVFAARRSSKTPGALAILACTAIVAIMAVSSVGAYRRLHRLNADYFKAIGVAIASKATPDEMVFISPKKFGAPPQVVYYARRNIEPYDGQPAAIQLMRRYNIHTGVVFELDQTRHFVAGVRRIAAD